MDDLRNIRKALGLNQTDFAAALGLHQSSISRMENGEIPIDTRTELAIEALVTKANAGSVLSDARAA